MSEKISLYSQIANSALLAGVKIPLVDPNDTSTAPAGPGGSDKVALLGQLLPGVVWPSGSTAGAKDVANVAAAIASDGAATLMPGIWYGASTVGITLGQSVGSLTGRPANVWRNVGSTAAFQLENTGSYSGVPASLTGLQIEGSGASSGACAFQCGDINGVVIDVAVLDFTGGNDGGLLLNAYTWTEQGRIRLFIQNCDNGLKLDQSGSGTNSFDRTRLDLTFNQGAGQNGVVLAGATAGVVLLGGALKMHGNWGGAGSAPSSSTLSFTSENAGIQDCNIEVNLETGGPFAAQTINFKDGTTNISDCWGGITWLNTGNSFAPSNNADNFTGFTGKVKGDPSIVGALPQKSTNAAIGSPQAIASTTPAAVTALAGGITAYTAYEVEAWVPYSSASTAGVPKFAFTGPGGQINTQLRYEFWSATGLVSSAQVTDYTSVVSGPTLTSSSALLVKIAGTVQGSAYGTLQLTAAEGTSGDSFSILLGAKITVAEEAY